MALTIDEIKKHILEAIPDASIEIKDLMGDNNHYSAIIKSKIFKTTPASIEFIKEGSLDFVEELGGSFFKIENPNSTANCGCGTSFSI